MKSIILLIIFGFLTWCTPTNGANILHISLTPSPSHHIWEKTIAMALKAKGHHITFVTHSPEKSTENFTTIIFEGIYDKLHSEYNYNDFADFNYLQGIIEIFNWFEILVDWDMESQGFKQLMDLVNKKPKFDVIIMDSTTAHYMYPIIEKLGFPPLVATSAFGIQPHHIPAFGLDIHYAYNPIYMLPFTDKMSFYERVQNYLYTNVYILYRQYYYMPSVWQKSQAYFGKDVTPYEEIEKHFSILLANFDPILDYPLSLPPSVIPVGGLHTKRQKSLPKDIQNILDDSKEGVLLFALGTNFLSKDLNPDQKQALIDGLGRVKQTILWKYEEEITGLPKNIITRKWLPQNDILAHPNLKAFLTHGGGLSTKEAMIHGVPVISMPFFADQYVNTQKLKNRKLGQVLKYGELTADIVYDTVADVLNTPDYKKNAEQLSKRFRDQKEDPLTRAIWWIEYCIREGGAQHLAVASRDIPYHVLNMLDMWAVVFVVCIGIVFVLNKICRLFCKLKSCSKNTSQKKKIN